MQKYPSLKKLGFLLAAFLLVAGLFTACSGGDSDDTPTLIPKYVTITYNANYIEEGATAAKTVQHTLTYYEGMVSVLYLPYNTFTRTGYKFLGWGTSSTSTKAEYYNGSSFSFRTDKTLYAIWEEAKPNEDVKAKTVKITFNANDGTATPGTKVQEVTADKSTTLEANTFTRTGYKFIGWAKTSSATEKDYLDKASFKTSEDVTLYAVWKDALHYYITFDKNGGEGTMATQAVTKSSDDATSVTATLNANTFTKSGYVFFGWHTSSSLSTYDSPAYFDEAEISLSSDKSLYAIWISESSAAKITYNKNDSGTASETKTQYLKKASRYDYEYSNRLRANPFTRTGYTFKGWSTSANSNYVKYSDKASLAFTTIDSDMTLYAVWEYSGTCTITFDKNASDAEGTMEAQSVTSGTSSTLTKNAFTRAGYNFIGWNKSSTATTADYADEASFKTSEPSVTLYAVWKKIPVITFDANGGAGTMENQTVPYNKSTRLTKNSFTREGYTFAGWSKTINTSTITYEDEGNITATIDTKLYAAWRADIQITLKANGGLGEDVVTTIKYSPADKKYTYTFPASTFTREGYSFAGYSEYSTSYSSSSIHKEGDSIDPSATTYYAQWKKDLEITLNPNGGTGATSLRTAKYSSSEGKYVFTFPEVTLSREGYSLIGWSTSSTATEAAYKTGDKSNPTRDTTYYAVWALNSNFTVSIKTPTIQNYNDISITYDEASHSLKASYSNETYFLWMIDENFKENFFSDSFNIYELSPGLHTVTVLSTDETRITSVVVNVTRK